MDNDVRNTEYCIGFSTAITRAMDAIDRERTTVGSHERIGIFRVFGRDAGYTALYTAYVTGVRCCIPEYKVDLKRLIDLLLNDKHNNPSNYSLIILSEGAEWQGYQVQEYGEPDADLGIAFGAEAPLQRRAQVVVLDVEPAEGGGSTFTLRMRAVRQLAAVG